MKTRLLQFADSALLWVRHCHSLVSLSLCTLFLPFFILVLCLYTYFPSPNLLLPSFLGLLPCLDFCFLWRKKEQQYGMKNCHFSWIPPQNSPNPQQFLRDCTMRRYALYLHSFPYSTHVRIIIFVYILCKTDAGWYLVRYASREHRCRNIVVIGGAHWRN